MLALDTTETAPRGRAARLRHATRTAHDGVDHGIMAVASPSSIEGYRRFLTIQYQFHRDISGLYAAARLRLLLPGLAERARLTLVAADIVDLGMGFPESAPARFAPGGPIDIPNALGWLYVAEGSNLGAAILRKAAAGFGLSDTHGARHLAPAPGGPAAHWRRFTAALDAIELDRGDEAKVEAGAREAFARVQALIDAQRG